MRERGGSVGKPEPTEPEPIINNMSDPDPNKLLGSGSDQEFLQESVINKFKEADRNIGARRYHMYFVFEEKRIRIRIRIS